MTLSAILLGVLLAPLLLHADAPARRITFPPPASDAPKLRHDDDLRTADSGLPKLYVLAPEDLGLTTREMPALFWYVSGPTHMAVKITLGNDADIDPVLELTPAGVPEGGIQRLDLSAHSVRLEPEVKYQFAVALLEKKNASDPAKQVFASGVIKRVRADDALLARLKSADRDARPAIFASRRIWYDALMALSDLIDAKPADADLRLERADLLDQVNLKAPADAERKAAAEILSAATTRPGLAP